MMALIFMAVYFAIRMLENAEAALEREFDRSEGLLLNLMPTSIASRLKNNPSEIIADHFDEVMILFADIVGFTPRASQLAPHEVVRYLNRVFSRFYRLAEKHRLEKIKTIGDAYMVAGGMPDPQTGHAVDAANMALEILEVTRKLSSELHEDIAVRIGIHTGPAVAGVIGTRKLFYDV
jgi:adenylate cyclase